MSREKEDIYTSLPTIAVSSRGYSTQEPRIVVRQEIHAGPKSTDGRDVRLILTPEEAARLASELMGMVPLSALESDEMRKHAKRIAAYLGAWELT